MKVIVLTSFSDQAHVLPALRAGASGYILKDVEPDQLVEAIRSAYKGNIQLHPDIANALLSQTLPVEEKEEESSIQVDVLTARENEVLRLLAKGMSNKEIASVLVITEKTVKAHVSSILSKLNLSDRTQAALYAVKMELYKTKVVRPSSPLEGGLFMEKYVYVRTKLSLYKDKICL